MTKLFISTVVVLFAGVIMSTNGQIAGGLGASKPIDDEVTALFARLKPDIIKQICDSGAGKCPSADSKIVLNSYKTQVVAGTNYFIAFTVDDTDTYHTRIFSQPWTKTEEIHGVTGPKQATEEISYF